MNSSSENKGQLETQIVDFLKSGDRQGVTIAYRNYGDTLYGMILRIVSSEVVAEEVLQDTFLKIWKNAHQYDPAKGRLFTWFANIARNTAIDKVRSASFRKGQKTQSMENFAGDSAAGVHHTTLADPGLQKVIDSLDEKHRLLIDLTFFKGYSQREIEKEFDIPLGTVKSRLRKAVNELRVKLGSEQNRNLLFSLLIIFSVIQFLLN